MNRSDEPRELTLFNAMAQAVIDDLDTDERSLLSEATFSKIIKACHRAAIDFQAPVAVPAPSPLVVEYPKMQFIRVATLRPGDHIWMTDCWFTPVDSTAPAGNKLHVFFMDGTTITLNRAANVRVAISADDARKWNSQFGRLDDESRQRVRDTHGPQSVAL